ncbi:MAG: hypothetical protein PVJ02_13815, partial [Gemmatimonadota bacterium]
IVYETNPDFAGHGDIEGVHAAGDTARVPLVATDVREGEPALSPDGRWLAYVSSDASGRPQVFVRPFPATRGSKWQVSAEGGTFPQWSHDGKTLFYMGTGWNARMMAASLTTSPAFRVKGQTALFRLGPFVRYGIEHTYAVAPDDRHFVLTTTETVDDPVVEMRNWLPEVQAKLKAQR